MLFGKKGKGVIRAREGIAKRFSLKNLIPPLSLTNFDINMHYQNEPRFNGAFSRNNLPNKFVNNKIAKYFDSFEVEHIPKEIKKIIGNENTIANIFRIQAYDLVMCGYFCIGFIDYMFKDNNS